MKKTIAQELGVTDFPFEIKDKRGNLIYKEWEDGYWERWEWDLNSKEIFYENLRGIVSGDWPDPEPVTDPELKSETMNQTIAETLGIKEFPFEIRDKQGNLVYLEFENQYWAKYKFDKEGKQIYYENSKGEIIDHRPQPEPTPTITLQHCLDRGFTVEKIHDEVYKEQHGKDYMLCYLKLSKRHMIDYCNAKYRCMVYKVDSEGTILERKYLKDVDDLDFYIRFLGT